MSATASRNPLLGEKDKFEEKTEAALTEHFCSTVSRGHTGKEKLVHYDAHKLLKYGAISTIASKGTIFMADKQLYIEMLKYLVVSLACLGIYIAVGPEEGADTDAGGILKALERLSRDLRMLTPFIFGLFVSLTLSRWWSMRISSLGVIMDGIVFNTMFLAGAGARKNLTPQEAEDFERDVMKVIKLGIASLQSITAHSRGVQSLQPLVDMELLTKEEAKTLEDCPNRAQVLWAWIGSLGANLLDRLKVPPPNHNPFYMENKAAANAITALEAYYDSQLPFPYVHMIVLLVSANNLMMSVVTAMQMAHIDLPNEWPLLVSGCFNLILVPIMYQALLFICFLVEDPLGDDVTDFPIIAFQANTYRTCKTILRATGKFWDLRREANIF